MSGGVVKLQPFSDALGFGWLKCFVERAGVVGVEVVHHQPDHLGIRVCLVHQPPHLAREVHGSAAPGHLDMLHPPFGSQNMNRFRVPFRWYSVS